MTAIATRPRSLVALDRAREALAEARTAQDFKAVRDAGHAAIKLAKSQRDVGTEVVNDAMEIVLEAERRIGTMLAETVDHQGGRPPKNGDAKSPLSELGISKKQSSRWQAEATVPDEQFRLWKEETREDGKQLTSGALIKLGKQHRKIWADPLEPIEGVCDSLQVLIDESKRFRCIYADPPWSYGNQETRASTDNHYGTMSVEDIAAEPVAAVAADNCHLHLWTTNAFLFEAHRIIEAWGFTYKSCFVWVKPQMGIGNYWRVSHEFLLLGIRGEATNFLANDEPSWVEANRTGHSRKPSLVREKVQRVSPGPYLEMYGREQTPGWTVYGNQISKGQQGRLGL